jgi:DNA mismatch repair protein MutL
MLRVVGQVGARYIVAEGPAGLYLVDQHGAHARILYENLHEELDAKRQVEARDIPPQTVELSRDEIALVEPRLSLLEQCGVLLEPFGPATYMLRTLPDAAANMDPMESISGLINDLLAQPRLHDDDFADLVFKHISSTAAYKAGQVLNQDDMQRIIRQLERSRTPREDPSGRPTLLHFSGDQLAREFGY